MNHACMHNLEHYYIIHILLHVVHILRYNGVAYHVLTGSKFGDSLVRPLPGSWIMVTPDPKLLPP